MSEAPHPTAGDEGALGALLVLLNDAADPLRNIQATYRTRHHEQRLREAFGANTEEQKLRGVSIRPQHWVAPSEDSRTRTELTHSTPARSRPS